MRRSVPSGCLNALWMTTTVPTGWRPAAPGASCAASRCITAPTSRLPAGASSIRRREDARPAPSGTTACGKTTVFRSGRMPRMSGTGRSFSFRTSVMRALSNNECLEEIDRLELAGGGPDERLARRPPGLVLLLQAALAQVRVPVFYLPLQLDHPEH